eukprot:TRINITY_DN3562_c0_g1_i1.p1 TRINITY_DN3562_c0_g1~~TRINITY_DN3562_c0_g1_i1.p1  ORF type:complete len:715 (+),score=165.48 TRINITY_DN3562_c0_g1_i1:94-2238(+)
MALAPTSLLASRAPRRVFGAPLSRLPLTDWEPILPKVVREMVNYIRVDLSNEHLFTDVPEKDVEHVVELYERAGSVYLPKATTEVVTCSLLLRLLRNLPAPLVPTSTLLALSRANDAQVSLKDKASYYSYHFSKLSAVHFNTLRLVVGLLHEISVAEVKEDEDTTTKESIYDFLSATEDDGAVQQQPLDRIRPPTTAEILQRAEALALRVSSSLFPQSSRDCDITLTQNVVLFTIIMWRTAFQPLTEEYKHATIEEASVVPLATDLPIWLARQSVGVLFSPPSSHSKVSGAYIVSTGKRTTDDSLNLFRRSLLLDSLRETVEAFGSGGSDDIGSGRGAGGGGGGDREASLPQKVPRRVKRKPSSRRTGTDIASETPVWGKKTLHLSSAFIPTSSYEHPMDSLNPLHAQSAPVLVGAAASLVRGRSESGGVGGGSSDESSVWGGEDEGGAFADTSDSEEEGGYRATPLPVSPPSSATATPTIKVKSETEVPGGGGGGGDSGVGGGGDGSRLGAWSKTAVGRGQTRSRNPSLGTTRALQAARSKLSNEKQEIAGESERVAQNTPKGDEAEENAQAKEEEANELEDEKVSGQGTQAGENPKMPENDAKVKKSKSKEKEKPKKERVKKKKSRSARKLKRSGSHSESEVTLSPRDALDSSEGRGKVKSSERKANRRLRKRKSSGNSEREKKKREKEDPASAEEVVVETVEEEEEYEVKS